MKRWEYTYHISGSGARMTNQALNELGQQGWEAYHVEQNAMSVTFYLKRESQTRGSDAPKPSLPSEAGV